MVTQKTMTPIKILISVVDDEKIWLDLIGNIFQGEPDYDVSYFINSNDFFKAFSKDIDLVIMDVRLKDGTDVTERINRIYSISPNCYIIVVSAYFDVPMLQDLIRLSVSDTIVKGENWLETLKLAIQNLHNKLRNRSEIRAITKKL